MNICIEFYFNNVTQNETTKITHLMEVTNKDKKQIAME